MPHFIFIGLDVYQKSIDVALAEGARDGEVRFCGKINGELSDVDRLIRRLGYKKDRLWILYEAGPYGYGLYRHLQSQGMHCSVVAPYDRP